MKVLGCTGGIGSGKTYVINIFRQLGVPAYFSDDRARELYMEDARLLEEMKKLLGEEIVQEGRLQTRLIAGRIFNDPRLLGSVESLVHPAVLRDFEKWKQVQQQKAHEANKKIPFAIFESAILLEKTSVRAVADKVLTVSAPAEVRIQRVMRRDGTDRESVIKRMSSQWSDARREALADFIIFADGKRAVLPQVLCVMEKMEKTD